MVLGLTAYKARRKPPLDTQWYLSKGSIAKLPLKLASKLNKKITRKL
jgi:hypothetical protein